MTTIPKTHEATITLEGHILEGQTLDTTGHDIRVTIIQGGKSRNGYGYDDNALGQIARMLEGAQAYADHGRSPADLSVRSVRDVVGFYHDAALVAGANGQPSRVDATLHIFEAANWLWSIIQEAFTLGKPNLIGLSIDIFGNWQVNEATRAKQITQVLALNSCDIVTKPSAGGKLNRILHDSLPSDDAQRSHVSGVSDGIQCDDSSGDDTTPNPTTPPKGDTSHMDTLTQDTADNAQNGNTPPNQTQGANTGATPHSTPSASHILTHPANGAIAPSATALRQDTRSHILEQQQILEAQRLQIEQMLAEARLQRAELSLERRLQESILPAAVKEQLKARYKGRVFEESELDAEMTSALQMMAQLTRDGLIRGHNYEKPSVGGMITEAEKVQAAFDRMFDLDIDTAKLGNIRGFSGIREAYARVTGDSVLAGGISGRSQLGNIRVNESAPVDRITEADTTTASFSYLLGTSMNKRLLKDYQAWPAEWQKFCTIYPIRDFKQQTRVRFGAFGSLPIVAEDTAYTTATLTDSAATYVAQKRGNLVTVSRETIINDDLQAIKQIPTKLAVAAAYTLAEFVYGFLSSNPTIYDGNALFTSGGAHSNLGSSALTSAAMQTGVIAMREQANYAGKRIGLRPRFLIVPPELEFIAMVVTKSAGVPGSTNNDINPMLGYVQPIVAPQLSNANQWFMSADPREVDTIEVGFVNGQVNPALFIQDMPLYGLNFTQDAISFKVRHEYGGAVVDYRGLYRGI